MRSAATFTALMATGVLIVLIYIRSGESVVALTLSIITLFVVLGLWSWRPWAYDEDRGPPVRLLDQRGEGEPSPTSTEDRACWRGPMDITWDERGISGVALGSAAPQLWSWSQIDDIGEDWCFASTGAAAGDGNGSDDNNGRDEDERLAFRLDFPDLRNPSEPAQAWLRYGSNQDPATVRNGARAAWRDSKVKRSRFYDLTAQERTLQLVEHLAVDQLDVSQSPRSPGVLYQEVRRELLSGGELCRLGEDASFDEVLDAFDAMLVANRAEGLSRDEADELAAADGPQRVASLHWTLDGIAEDRGFRMVFLDQRQPNGRGGDEDQVMDYLIGLIPAAVADDWDGQVVGSGSARVSLDRPIG